MSLNLQPAEQFTPSGDNLCLIDGDIIRYSSAAASDQVSYHWEGHESTKYKKDALAYGHEHNLNPDNLIKTVTPEPVEYCLHTIKQMIHSIMDATNSGKARIFLTGEGNYREDIDSIAPYKGQRPTEKPTHFEAAGKYLIEQFDAEVIEGKEADDAMATAQFSALNPVVPPRGTVLHIQNTVICTRDKDLKMVAGWHYDWTKEDGMVWITKEEGLKFFYTQLLTGDSTDNIKGIKGIGPAKANKLLEGLSEPLELYEACLAAYEQSGQDSWDLLENATLLWMQTEEDTYWTPPKKR